MEIDEERKRPSGCPKTGTYAMAISRGATTLTIENYLTEPVAQFRVDTNA